MPRSFPPGRSGQSGTPARPSAFSLVELSIVLVILGLLVGGILGGQSLIHAAELRSVVTERDKYTLAINAFRLKYDGLPGDIPNATQYWAAANPTPATCLTTVRSSASTCNGDGNDQMNGGFAYPASFEHKLAWEQLGLAGLIEGSYKGYAASAPTGGEVLTGTTNPVGKLGGSGWVLVYGPEASINGQSYGGMWEGKYKNMLAYARYDTTASNWYVYGTPNVNWGVGYIFNPQDASSIDAKIDDGKPGTGAVRTFGMLASYTSNCTDLIGIAQYATAKYALGSTDVSCKLFFDLGY